MSTLGARSARLAGDDVERMRVRDAPRMPGGLDLLREDVEPEDLAAVLNRTPRLVAIRKRSRREQL